jgi:hypothetical protein
MSVKGIGSSNREWDCRAILNESQRSNQTTGTTNSSDSSGSGGTKSTNPMLASSAWVLNLSTSQIQQDVSDGQSLSRIASTQGVSQSTLLSAIESSLQNGPFGHQSHPINSPTWRPPSPTTPERSPRNSPRHRTPKPRRLEAIHGRLVRASPPAWPVPALRTCPSWPTTQPRSEARAP